MPETDRRRNRAPATFPIKKPPRQGASTSRSTTVGGVVDVDVDAPRGGRRFHSSGIRASAPLAFGDVSRSIRALGERRMTLTLAATLAAHQAGKPLAETIRQTYARIAAHADPALFIALRPEAEALAEAERLQAAGP